MSFGFFVASHSGYTISGTLSGWEQGVANSHCCFTVLLTVLFITWFCIPGSRSFVCWKDWQACEWSYKERLQWSLYGVWYLLNGHVSLFLFQVCTEVYVISLCLLCLEPSSGLDLWTHPLPLFADGTLSQLKHLFLTLHPTQLTVHSLWGCKTRCGHVSVWYIKTRVH